MIGILRSTILALALFAVVGSVLAAEASGQAKLREITKRMDDHNRSLSTLRAKVTMVKRNAQLGNAETTVGTAIYAKRPGKDALVRIDWQRPDESLAVVDGRYYMYRPRTNMVLTGSIKDVGKAKPGDQPKGTSALAFMNMSRAQLDANYTVALENESATLSNGVQTFHLRLTPKTQASYKDAELWVDVNGMPVQTKINEHNNDSTTVLLSDLQKNVSLTTSNFKIDWPKGTKVQKS
ncbi:MAG TPA: outer-membrane lipoprotein carrier protein LolA [Pyrinomonadaceae bacterium]|nr:outer-membrane lipoprotein carrier protein LolA [Pyrinomonadaceae bacterium]